MSEWPAPDQTAVYQPPKLPAESAEDERTGISLARARDGLPVDDRLVDEALENARREGPRTCMTAAEQQDVYDGHKRVELARGVLADAKEVFAGLEVCWLAGRRALRVRLTGELERYTRLLADAVGADRVVVEQARFTEAELESLHRKVREQSEELRSEGIMFVQTGPQMDAIGIAYHALDKERAQRILEERFGDFASLTYKGAARRGLRAHAFGSWMARDNELHVFYALGRNGERPGTCTGVETAEVVIVALTILDSLGPKRLLGGFTPSHATVKLASPLGTRVVIDNAHNRVRPQWTIAAASRPDPPQSGLIAPPRP